jgi:hypothetical protein
VLTNYLVPLVLFVALILAASLYALAVSGHFPGRQNGTAFASTLGTVILFGSMALTIVTLAGGFLAALLFVPWYAAIIGAGFALLTAPPVLRCFPDHFVDGRGAPLAFAGIGTALAIVLIWLAVSHRCTAGSDAQESPCPHRTADLLDRNICC